MTLCNGCIHFERIEEFDAGEFGFGSILRCNKSEDVYNFKFPQEGEFCIMLETSLPEIPKIRLIRA